MADERSLRAIRPPDGTDDEGDFWNCDHCHTPTSAGDCVIGLDHVIRCEICHDLFSEEN